MAKSRLTPDYIEWVMSLNANQALREIHKVNEVKFLLLPHPGTEASVIFQSRNTHRLTNRNHRGGLADLTQNVLNGA